jgi:deoxyribonuclease (pyrimidine dimer)
MTRINCGIPPRELNNKHLFAEYREMKRIPNCIIKGRYSLKDAPKEFTLGKGHVKFFYDKLLYLKNRNDELKDECLLRGIKITDYSETYDIAISLFPNLANDYIPNDVDREIIRNRINERLSDIDIKKKNKINI